MRNIFLVFVSIFVSATFHFSYGQSEDMNKLSASLNELLKGNGWSPLGTWNFDAEDLPFTNEIYLHQGNQYLVVAFQEYKNPPISFSLTKVFPDKSTKFLANSNSFGEGTGQALRINATKKTDGISYYFSLEQKSGSNDETMVAIFYKSNDNESSDPSENATENYLTKAEQRNWAELIHNVPRKQNPPNWEGVVKSTLSKVEVENIETKTIVWKGDVSDMYSISDNYVSYGLTTKKNFVLSSEFRYFIENIKTGKKYQIESDFPIFLINDSLVYRPESIEDFKERVGTVINFETNEEVYYPSINTRFSSFESKGKNLETALEKGFELSGFYTIKKTGERILWLGSGYYIKDPTNRNQNPVLYGPDHQAIDLPEIRLASFSHNFYEWALNKPRNWIGEERFYLPRFGQYSNVGYRYVILTKEGYYEINTKTKEVKPTAPKFAPVIANNKYRPDIIQLERGILYISAYEEGESEKVRALYDKNTQKFKYYGEKDAEERKIFEYLKVYEHKYSKFSNVLSPKHLRLRLVDF
ncbi:MAG: hypothetical protein AAF502_02285 [Bacteroidota bacterium]